MSRKLHDTFAKEWLKELLADFGDVEIERQVSGEVRTIDLLFYPDADRTEDLKALGLLGQMLSKPCPIEFFRNAVPAKEIANCRKKVTELRWEQERIAAQKQQKLRESDLPFLWILSPTVSAAMRQTFHMEQRSGWGEGVYFLPKWDFTAVVAIHELPVSIDTLWLRLLGKGSVQAKAVQELMALPETQQYRLETLHHLAMLQVSLQIRQNKTRDLKEVIMNLAPVYEEWLAKTLAQGEAQGEQTKGIKIARRLLSKNMPLEEISEITELSIAEIQAIQAEKQA